MSDGSDIEMRSTLPKKQTKKIPRSPSEEILKVNQEPKKVSTKVMIHQALTDLKSRKGTSLYAIKKYIHEKFNVDVKKINSIIKKLIKAEVEAGTIIQTKGIGASGSFKLVVGKDKVEKKKAKTKKLAEKIKESDDKPTSKKSIKPKTEAKTKKNLEKKSKKKENVDNIVEVNQKKVKAKEGRKEGKEGKDGKMKKTHAKKLAKGMPTPAKKRAAMMRRRSIGSIIKPPKMKPKANA